MSRDITPDQLYPDTAAVLRHLEPEQVTVVGGSLAISEAVAASADEAAGGVAVRLGGPSRDATAVAVGAEVVQRLERGGHGDDRHAVAVNVRRDDGYAHVLSASAIAGFLGAVFIPVEGVGGTAR